MKCKKETDYRRSTPESVYELKKVAIKLRKKTSQSRRFLKSLAYPIKQCETCSKNMMKAESLQSSPRREGGKPGKNAISAQRRSKICWGLLVDHNLEQFKIKECLWTRDSVRELIKQKYGIEMPIRTVGEYPAQTEPSVLPSLWSAHGKAGTEWA